MKNNGKNTGAEEAKSLTSILLVDLGIITCVVTWLRGYQGDLKRYVLELTLALLLGAVSGALFEAVAQRHRRWAGLGVLTMVVIAALFGANYINWSEPFSGVLKVLLGGALYGAFLSTTVAALLSAIAQRLFKQVAPQEDS